VDIQAQSLGNLAQDVTVESSRSVTEVNGSQTATVGAGKTQVTTIRADAGEVWSLEKFNFDYVAENVPFEVTVRTESVNAEVGFAREDDSTTDRYFYKSGQWFTFGTQAWDDTRDDIRGTQIDDTNGLEVEFRNTGGSDITNGRDLLFQFEVTQVA